MKKILTLTLCLALLLGLFSGICLFVTAWMRDHDRATYPPLELVPDVYLVVKLILNFKGWSTDPIILDYCIMLFALIFVVLGFYYSTGFLFDLLHGFLELFLPACNQEDLRAVLGEDLGALVADAVRARTGDQGDAPGKVVVVPACHFPLLSKHESPPAVQAGLDPDVCRSAMPCKTYLPPMSADMGISAGVPSWAFS